MNNYTCYKQNFLNEFVQKSFEKRYESIHNNSDFIGLSRLDYKDGKLLRESLSYRSVLEEKRQYFADSKKKRVFISHKMEDKGIAIALAKRLDSHGISYWLDVLDPQLSQVNKVSSENKAIVIANIIELGLLNCTAVVAILTNNSCNSQWIPYEYGRVKEPKLQVDNAYALTHGLTNPIPAYMYLGKIYKSESSLMQSI